MRFILDVMVLISVSSPALAQKPAEACSGDAAEIQGKSGPRIYRDCEVDRPATLSSGDPELDLSSLRGTAMDIGCLKAELQFVVDPAGRAELETVKIRSTNNSSFAAQVQASLPSLRYRPALKAGRPVRQLVVYARSMVPRVPLVVGRIGGTPPPPSPNPPRC